MLVNQHDKLPLKTDNIRRLLFIGDVMGDQGIAMCQRWLPRLKEQLACDGIIVNGENSAKDGRGLMPQGLTALLGAGADVVTTGNHIWRHATILPILAQDLPVIRPANFPTGSTPGKGFVIVEIAQCRVAVVNLLGRIFFREMVECPFKTMQQLLPHLNAQADLVVVDFHAEATSEKAALGHFLDGQVAAVVGTHTHIQTLDARILPKGTAFMTDLGAICALNSCIGMEKEIIIEQMISQLPAKFKVDQQAPFVFSGAIVDCDLSNRRAQQIYMLRFTE